MNSSLMINSTVHNDAADKIHQHMQAFFTQGEDEIVALLSILIILFIAFCLFVVFLLLHGHQHHNIYNHLAASCTLAHIPTALFFHAGSIHIMFVRTGITLFYCKMWLWILEFMRIVIPYTLLMFSIERLMYIHKRIGHRQRINYAGHITLIAFPWGIATFISSIIIFCLNTSYGTVDARMHHSRFNFDACSAYKRYDGLIEETVTIIIGGVLPLVLCLIITITVLIMWCCYKKKHALGRDYAMMGEQIEITVRNSVIAVSVLNFLYIATFLVETGFSFDLEYGLFSVFGVIECIIWLTTIADVRDKFVSLFACCRRNSSVIGSAGGSTVEDPNKS